MLSHFLRWLDSDSPGAVVVSAVIAFVMLWLIIGLLFALC